MLSLGVSGASTCKPMLLGCRLAVAMICAW